MTSKVQADMESFHGRRRCSFNHLHQPLKGNSPCQKARMVKMIASTHRSDIKRGEPVAPQGEKGSQRQWQADIQPPGAHPVIFRVFFGFR